MKVIVTLRQSESDVGTVELTLRDEEGEEAFQKWAHAVCWQGLTAEGLYIPAGNISFIQRLPDPMCMGDDKVVRLKQ